MAESVARQRINWRVLGVEAAAIFFSVLLGFGVTEWREARAERRAVEQAMTAYAAEIADNQERVAQVLRYHKQLNVALLSAAGEIPEGQNLFEILADAGWNGPRQVVFVDAARETAEATGVLGLLPFEDASALVRLYDAQDELDLTEQALADAAFNPAVLDETNTLASVRSVSVYFQMIDEQETNLLHGFRETITALNLDIAPAADTLLGTPAR